MVLPETTDQTPRKLTISGNEFVLIATGVFSSFSRHKLFKDKFMWKSHYIRGTIFGLLTSKKWAKFTRSAHLPYRHWRHVQQSDATPVNVWAVQITNYNLQMHSTNTSSPRMHSTNTSSPRAPVVMTLSQMFHVIVATSRSLLRHGSWWRDGYVRLDSVFFHDLTGEKRRCSSTLTNSEMLTCDVALTCSKYTRVTVTSQCKPTWQMMSADDVTQRLRLTSSAGVRSVNAPLI
jgi:hypothetical protein